MAKTRLSFLTFLAYLIVARLSCPALSNIPFMNMGFVFIYGLAFAILFLFTTSGISTSDTYMIICLTLYIVYVLLQIFISGGSVFDTQIYKIYVIAFMSLIYIWSKQQTLTTRKNLMLIILGTSIFNYIYSIIVLFFDPNASRIAAATSVLEASPYDILHAVGSFDAVNGAIFVIIILLYIRNKLSTPKVKFVITLVIALAAVFIIMASYVTAIILLILALCLYIGRKNKALSYISTLLIITLIIFHEQLGDFLMKISFNISYSETVGSKFYEFGYMIRNLEATGTYGGTDGRMAKMLTSINAFTNYPILGGLTHPDVKIGGHSEVFDILGNFGIVGFSLIAFYLRALYISLRRSVVLKDSKKCTQVIFIVFVIGAVLNPTFYTLQMLPIILMIYLSESFLEYYTT
ncbi:MAG: hypothetical protein IJN94_02275 [Clostridia bacterium]|nr:hypothetical protein [Clostridia bacterium]